MNASQTTEQIIALDQLQFSYNGSPRPVLHDLTLTIPPQTITAILGPNGSGKTTLMHILMGLLKPQSGTLMLAGKRHETYGRRDLSQLLGLVPQEEQIPFNFSVLEYVLLGRAPYLGMLEKPTPEDREVAHTALATMGMASHANSPINTLSGGERQLVTVARALAQGPRILLLDEPTSHLDLSNRSRILEMMRALASEGITVIFTTHDPEAAALIAKYTILMQNGQALAAGTLEEVFTTENLSATYNVPVEVTRLNGRTLVMVHDSRSAASTDLSALRKLLQRQRRA